MNPDEISERLARGECVALQPGWTMESISKWRAPRDGDEGKYAFIDCLPADAPPSLLR